MRSDGRRRCARWAWKRWRPREAGLRGLVTARRSRSQISRGAALERRRGAPGERWGAVAALRGTGPWPAGGRLRTSPSSPTSARASGAGRRRRGATPTRSRRGRRPTTVRRAPAASRPWPAREAWGRPGHRHGRAPSTVDGVLWLPRGKEPAAAASGRGARPQVLTRLALPSAFSRPSAPVYSVGARRGPCTAPRRLVAPNSPA
mmetsp:Transcript_91815/g.239375  ORF Transcript_91815/g.239375 Transcript_91815/m.239375 type:complete len:204 (-) Transcript_91815:2-613(-)